MRKSILFFSVFISFLSLSKAQSVMQLSGEDCNGTSHDLYADLDAGKVVILHFFMPNCGSCPPPAKKIQKMANNILAKYPGMITGYALPFDDNTTCSYTSTWVSSNQLFFYAPYDSGSVQVANYGGFGMPTVVVLAGAGPNRRVMFVTQTFYTSDTTEMRDSILSYIYSTNGIKDLPASINSFQVYPNPLSDEVSVEIDCQEMSALFVDLIDASGRQAAVLLNEKQKGKITRQFQIPSLPEGIYLIRLQTNGSVISKKVMVLH